MRNKRTQLAKKETPLIKKTEISSVLQFSEYPTQDTVSGNSPGAGTRIAASDLFSFFTADIIKEKKLFTR
jgi:hypothetical protein